MLFTEQKIQGSWLIEPEPIRDERGFFARVWGEKELTARGLNTRIVHCSISHNPRKGTLRGLHYQAPPYQEAKLVRCVRGAIYDVVLDLRPDSPTFKHWAAAELTAENRRLLYIPEGCAHGYQTLVDDTEVCYECTAEYVPAATRGVRWNDPLFAVQWPLPVSVMSERDTSCPDFVLPQS